jgi:hypothetical protein
MPVGMQATNLTIDQTLTTLATSLRNIMEELRRLSTFVNNGAGGTPVQILTAAGYNNANSNAPGNQSDAAYAAYMIGLFNTVSALYYGTATQPSAYNYDTALAPLWAGLVQ